MTELLELGCRARSHKHIVRPTIVSLDEQPRPACRIAEPHQRTTETETSFRQLGETQRRAEGLGTVAGTECRRDLFLDALAGDAGALLLLKLGA